MHRFMADSLADTHPRDKLGASQALDSHSRRTNTAEHETKTSGGQLVLRCRLTHFLGTLIGIQ